METSLNLIAQKIGVTVFSEITDQQHEDRKHNLTGLILVSRKNCKLRKSVDLEFRLKKLAISKSVTL